MQDGMFKTSSCSLLMVNRGEQLMKKKMPTNMPINSRQMTSLLLALRSDIVLRDKRLNQKLKRWQPLGRTRLMQSLMGSTPLWTSWWTRPANLLCQVNLINSIEKDRGCTFKLNVLQAPNALDDMWTFVKLVSQKNHSWVPDGIEPPIF